MTERELIEPTEALIDLRVLQEFLDLLGSEGPQALHSIVETFLQETPPVVEDLGDALGRGDYGGAAWLAHRLKGSCASIGARRLGARCSTLEAACNENQRPPVATYAAIVADFTATRGALKSFLREVV